MSNQDMTDTMAAKTETLMNVGRFVLSFSQITIIKHKNTILQA